MSDAATVAVIAAVPPTLAAVLGYLSNRSVRRAIATSDELPIGALVERIEARVEHLDGKLTDVGRRVARLEGRSTVSPQLRRRVHELGDDMHALFERLVRHEAKEPGA